MSKTKKISLSEAYLLGNIASAAKRDWRAAVWLLEKKNPQKWGDTKNTSLEELTVNLANSGLLSKTQVEALADLSDETKEKVLGILAQSENNILSGVRVTTDDSGMNPYETDVNIEDFSFENDVLPVQENENDD